MIHVITFIVGVVVFICGTLIALALGAIGWRRG